MSYEPKVSDFLALTKKEEILPKALTRLKTVSISTKDVISVKESESLCDIDLLVNVPLDKYRYVGVLGVVFTGEWLVPDFVKGGVTVSVVLVNLSGVTCFGTIDFIELNTFLNSPVRWSLKLIAFPCI